MQSIVNLKLLRRAADAAQKRPVIVTSNQALTQLAGGLNIYVAKTLQSKPSIPSGIEIENIHDDSVEVSDGVGELDEVASNTVSIDESDEVVLSAEELVALDEIPDGTDKKPITKPKDKKKKIPNFNSFRKKYSL